MHPQHHKKDARKKMSEFEIPSETQNESSFISINFVDDVNALHTLSFECELMLSAEKMQTRRATASQVISSQDKVCCLLIAPQILALFVTIDEIRFMLFAILS